MACSILIYPSLLSPSFLMYVLQYSTLVDGSEGNWLLCRLHYEFFLFGATNRSHLLGFHGRQVWKKNSVMFCHFV